MLNPKLKSGDEIVCIHMDGDSSSVPVGTRGVVTGFSKDVFGDKIDVKWENGSTLSLLPDADSWMLAKDLKKS
jgi:hypothetical protein